MLVRGIQSQGAFCNILGSILRTKFDVSAGFCFQKIMAKAPKKLMAEKGTASFLVAISIQLSKRQLIKEKIRRCMMLKKQMI